MHIRWKLFISFFFVSMMILLILWSCQVLFISSFYQYVKTGELKRATNEVIANLEAQLTKNGCQSGIERLYWLPLEKERLLPVQREHESSCGPHCLALEILDDAVRLEFLVRAKGRMRCECVCYLSPETERHMMDWLDARIMEAEIEQGLIQQ